MSKNRPWGHKKTREWKEESEGSRQKAVSSQQTAESSRQKAVSSQQTAEGSKQSASGERKLPSKGNGGGHFWCGHSGNNIDTNVCLVRQTRMPETCRPCDHFKGGAA
jgi:hypothetical protein